jgi:hypothetical protein
MGNRVSDPNPLTESLWKLFDHLNIINGLLFLLAAQLRGYVAQVRELTKGKPSDHVLFASVSLTVSDVSLKDDLIEFFASGGLTAHGEEFLQVAEQLISRNAGWSIAQGWERFESYLKDVTSAYLQTHPADAEKDKLESYLAKLGLGSLRSFDDWRQFVARRYGGQNNEELFRFLRSLAPDLVGIEVKNAKRVDLARWYKVAAVVRHASTHSNGVVEPEQRAKVDDGLLQRWFPGEDVDGTYALRISVTAVDDALQTFAEYGFLIFKLLCQKAGYHWDILAEGRPLLVRHSDTPAPR